ncbi:DGPFAETKE family protein [Sphingobium sp. HDIP04]|nr:DGPFAETKE family protein [Sphingobium sp. HDIP04]
MGHARREGAGRHARSLIPRHFSYILRGPAAAKPQSRRMAMRVMVLVKATEDSERGFDPTPQTMAAMEAMGRFNDQLAEAGILLAADGLTPSSQGKRIAFDGPNRTVIDGPFAQTRELVAGFWLWEVKDMEEAIAWAKRCPNPMPGPSEIEIRPLYDLGDLS